MDTESCTLLTILTEAKLEQALTDDAERLGARGWTVTDARGKGEWGEREADWASSGNIRLEVVCAPSVAEQIAEYVTATYGGDHPLVLYLSDVRVPEHGPSRAR
jgi:hypothetical protein